MRQTLWVAAVLAALSAGRGLAAELSGGQPCEECFLKRLGPVGGWHPDGGGLLHWWPACCFPCGGAPDDYCRKPLPKVCWPPYPPYYTWGPPEMCWPRNRCKQP
jgi:hypothetical protein